MKKSNVENTSNTDKKEPRHYRAISHIRYYDDVLEQDFFLNKPWESQCWKVSINGCKSHIVFDRLARSIRDASKGFLISFMLEKKISMVVDSFKSLINFSKYLERKAIDISAIDIKTLRSIYYGWKNDKLTSISYEGYVRTFLAYLASINHGNLTSRHIEEIRNYNVEYRLRDARIRSGDSKLTFREEFLVTQYLDKRVEYWNHANRVNSKEELLHDSVLVICYCLGLRAKQLSMLKINALSENGSDDKYYDLAVPVIKQRGRAVEPFRKALPSKWQDIIIKFWRLRKQENQEDRWANTPLLSLSSKVLLPQEFTEITKSVTGKILGSPKTVYEFRHTFAQRLADSGASSIDVATALTHVTTETAQSYVEASPEMARIISEALGRSSVYKDLPDLFEGKLKIKEVYDKAEPNKKISGLVDGIIMPGIGLCDVGLNLCDRSPLLSCHTCPKFMPVLDTAPHEKLASQLRKIVHRFKSEAIDQNQPSPPLAKLGATLAVIEDLIEKIKEASVE